MRILLLAMISIIIISCSNDDIRNLPPREFNAIAVQSGFNSITFRWTESTDPENSIVKYNVFISENVDEADYELIAENLSEQLVADTNVINVNGENISIDSPENPEYRFAYIATGLKHNTQYKGKIVAFDQEGNTSESYFYSTTLNDNIVPEISFNLQSVYRYNAMFQLSITDNDNNDIDWNLYLNNQLHTSVSVGEFGYHLEDLEEDTSYSGKIIATDSNGNESIPYEFSFATTGDTYIGNLEFIQINESAIHFFDENQYVSVNGNIFLNGISFSESTLSSFNYIQNVTGNITFDPLYTANPDTMLFPDLTQLNGDLVLIGNNLSNHFKNLETISGDLRMIRCEQNVENNPMFENLTSVDDFLLQEGGNINPQSLNSLNTINGKLSILFMYSTFQNLDFLSNVAVITNGLEIFDNNSLINFCGLDFVVNSNGLYGNYSVNENAYNPTISDIKNGDCNQ
ncbi:fibronectin type III domain-containing protein [Flagellimonas marina]|uniref:Fibronectin type III domain-containing protein n=1 Tax=Flagellimonas marina TaxID=1775168 RepID=A0ABV8PK43_9FLAO